jgi:hypothetical protein
MMGLFLSALLVSCDTSDDNNPSPVPDVRDKFIGTWSVNETCTKGNYQATIEKDPANTAQVIISNFADSKANQPDTCLVVAGNIVLYAQYNSEGWFIQGSGEYTEDGEINWNYNLLVSGYEESCSATFSKN